MTDTIQIAYECGAITGVKSSLNTSSDSVYFLPEELEAFRKCVENEMKEQLNDSLWGALQSDLENGIKWLNESAWKEFEAKYPELQKFIALMGEEK